MLLSVAALMALVGLGSAKNLRSREFYEAKFHDWVKKFDFQVANGEEFTRRLAAFSDNYDYIENHNAKNLSYWMGLNQFSAYTYPEFRELMGLNNPLPKFITEGVGESPEAPPPLNTNLQSSIDWVSKGCVTGVKNQGSCGSCWAFSTTGSVEGAYATYWGYLPDSGRGFSEQQLVDCETTYGDNGCNGGWATNAYNWIYATNGICAESSYGYTGVQGYCKSCSRISGSRVLRWYSDSQTEYNLQLYVNMAPTSVALDASYDFQHYLGGVFTGACSTTVNHAVLAVGYNTGVSPPYWKIKNSWGTSWGESGYIRLQYLGGGSSPGLCGVAQYGYVPLVY
jgi:KDEL-tailed cysteine endopeptidase